jgi:diguanylate cyclase (GGDEF)-like protein
MYAGDDFKQVNDGYGHSAGDRVLQEFAERLRKASRGADVAGRYGGDGVSRCCQSARPKVYGLSSNG